MRGLTLDTGALIALDKGDQQVAALLRVAAQAKVVPTVPVGCLAQAWPGGPPQARLARVLMATGRDDLDEGDARRCGALLARSGTVDVIDAHVVLGALARGDAVLSGDAADLLALAAAAGATLVVHEV